MALCPRIAASAVSIGRRAADTVIYGKVSGHLRTSPSWWCESGRNNNLA
jgi:hypothetical protein